MNNGGRTNEVQAALDRYFEGMPVKEASGSLVIRIYKRDAKKAESGSPTDCVIARACARQYGSRAVVILRRTAYVDLLDTDGVRRVYRFRVPPKVQQAIAVFDITGVFPDKEIQLNRMEPSRRLDNMRTAYHRRKALIKGEATGKASKRCKPLVADLVRNGSGLVHFRGQV